MSVYRNNQHFFNQPYLLAEEQRRNPLEVVSEFFSRIKLYEAREDLAILKLVALTSENDEFAEPTERANILAFFERLEELVEAAYLLMPKSDE